MTAWAFVVGINAYDEAATTLKPLAGAVADAADFAEWALDPTGGGVLGENLYFWTCEAPSEPGPNLRAYLDAGAKWPTRPPDFSRPPSALEINVSIDKVACAAAADGATRLYVFFAGHGMQTRSKDFGDVPQACFLAGDFSPEMLSTGIVPCGHLERMLTSLGPPQIVMLLDMCRSRAPLLLPPLAAPWNLRNPNGQHERLAVGRAAQGQAVAFEVPHGAPKRGAFTQLVVEALRNHRVNGQLKVRDLDDYVSGAMPALVRPEVQYPDFHETPRPPTLVLAQGDPPPPTAQLRLTAPGRPAGEKLMLVGGPANEEIELTVGDLPDGIPLAPGSYVIETAEGVTLADFKRVGPEDAHVEI